MDKAFELRRFRFGQLGAHLGTVQLDEHLPLPHQLALAQPMAVMMLEDFEVTATDSLARAVPTVSMRVLSGLMLGTARHGRSAKAVAEKP